MQAGLVVRDVVESDRGAIAGIVEGCTNLTREEKDCAQELLDIYLSKPAQRDYNFLAASVAGVVAGYVCFGKRPLTEATFDMYWIVVDPSMRGRGVGRRLLEGMERVLKALDARIIVAETSGLESYSDARRFYTGNGYAEEARIKDFYKPGDDLIAYVKRLRVLQA